jgi:hypothetical protein
MSQYFTIATDREETRFLRSVVNSALLYVFYRFDERTELLSEK